MGSLAARFWSRVEVSEGCWEWTGGRTLGYGRIAVNGKDSYAHRVSWELHYGPIPVGLQVDHLCRNRACVRPDHLEPVSQRENILRGTSPIAKLAAQTHCIRGHEFTPENTRVRAQGYRNCRECDRLRRRERWLTQRR